MKVVFVPRDEWIEKCAENAHLAVFEEAEVDYSKSMFQYAMVVIHPETDKPIIYTTVRATSKDTVCLEYGGSFPLYRGTPSVARAFRVLTNRLKESGIKNIILVTAQKNVAMQKLALGIGFLVYGVTIGKSGLCLEYRLNFEDKEEKENG